MMFVVFYTTSPSLPPSLPPRPLSGKVTHNKGGEGWVTLNFTVEQLKRWSELRERRVMMAVGRGLTVKKKEMEENQEGRCLGLSTEEFGDGRESVVSSDEEVPKTGTGSRASPSVSVHARLADT
ncbi:hypothetical protein E2C01_009507 [Portunus trituberculatus]|uniref:Uncharacterized protein n=1 Tax=Portunus trituberculatus TaxID=210409 RepID=A0A5B7D5Z0_PORTR|nr:hypothetical protein [Portunus trituberculatus]